MAEDAVFVIIHGNDWSIRDRNPNDYVAGIVYGSPEVTTVVVNGNFVALCEFPADQLGLATHTFDRMPSFPYGAQLILERPLRESALKQFGAWVYHYAGTKVPEEVS